MEPLRVPPEAAGERVDQFLAEHLGSRAQAQRRIEAGAVALDGVRARKNDRLRGGETIVIAPSPVVAVPSAGEVADFVIMYEDPQLIVVEKPAGVVVHPAGPHREGTLSQALARHCGAGGDPWRRRLRAERVDGGRFVGGSSRTVGSQNGAA